MRRGGVEGDWQEGDCRRGRGGGGGSPGGREGRGARRRGPPVIINCIMHQGIVLSLTWHSDKERRFGEDPRAGRRAFHCSEERAAK